MPDGHGTFDRKSTQNSPLRTFDTMVVHPTTIVKYPEAAFIGAVRIVLQHGLVFNSTVSKTTHADTNRAELGASHHTSRCRAIPPDVGEMDGRYPQKLTLPAHQYVVCKPE
ncbi:hypothetical protein G5B00_05740 [Parapedobacter sp. SGR-10]|uniref:hypothetical protein n=1 Tax=Parapedobacter sp. SGR-10 TaxID=2710879 RepID=UPI0013D1E1C5|nr:hypothetical protein [Parapedobacter sp. SGR-10]NGF56013.1 hypothetical protein [Parapedobacter sp. SGR-10]